MTADRHARLARTRVYLVASFPVERAGPALAAVAAAARATSGAGADVTSPGSGRPVVGAVQLRCKDAPTETQRALLLRARQLLPPDTLLLVNDDLDAVFDAIDEPLADGVHLGREDAAAIGLAAARERLGPDLLLGTSTRTLAEIDAALAAGADHVGFGAMAPSTTKTNTSPADPAELARCLAAHPDLPIFPIGGLGPDTLHLVTAAGGRRAAIGAAIQDASDPAAASLACLNALNAG
ncbi:MAG: thiamine phosphate synthase [Planctomycetota bacterium]|jgi:thiamine-phosphate pyrophosphorylase